MKMSFIEAPFKAHFSLFSGCTFCHFRLYKAHKASTVMNTELYNETKRLEPCKNGIVSQEFLG